jgi:hypothetical protein
MFGLDLNSLGPTAAAKMIKPYIGSILSVVVREIIRLGGGDPETDACLLYKARRTDGTPIVMAKVFRKNDTDDPEELIGLVDVHQAAADLDLSKFLSNE